MLLAMGQVPLERDIKIAVNGCSGFTTSTQKGPFKAMLISRSRGTCFISKSRHSLQNLTAAAAATTVVAASVALPRKWRPRQETRLLTAMFLQNVVLSPH